MCAGFAQTPTATPQAVTITVQPGERQTFGGFGASLLNFGGEYQTLTPAQRQTLSGSLWRGLNFKILRLWFNTDQYAPTPGAHDLEQFRRCYVDSGIIADAKRNGVTTLLLAPDHLPDYMAERSETRGSSGTHMALKLSATDDYAAMVAEFIERLRKECGVKIDVTGVHNEPNDTFRFAPEQIVAVVKRLRTELDRRGLKSVQIIAPEDASVDGGFYAQVDDLKVDKEAWRDLSGVASHSYNMAATPDIAKRVTGSGKSYWMTEASDNGPESPGDRLRAASLASRFLNDMNHGVTHWIHFVGFEVDDPKDDATRILAYTPHPFQVTTFEKYYYYEQLARTFDVGAVFRRSTSSSENEMTYTYGKKPRLTVAAARNPDGTWGVGVSNFTSPTFSDTDNQSDFDSHNGGYGAQAFDVTVKIGELRDVPRLRFTVRRGSAAAHAGSAETAVMHRGEVVIPNVGPLDLITLRSEATQSLFRQAQER